MCLLAKNVERSLAVVPDDDDDDKLSISITFNQQTFKRKLTKLFTDTFINYCGFGLPRRQKSPNRNIFLDPPLSMVIKETSFGVT